VLFRSSVAPLSVVNDIVTDDGLSPEYREALEREGITIHIAALTGGGTT
jgi:DeoR/GlpR family transcriptional regulator of sugar metabolism